MTSLTTIFRILSAAVSLYSMLCFFRIILTWVPSFSWSKPARFLSSLCDPYMNMFRGIKWLRMGSFDFSPALALCLLGALSSVFTMLGNGGTISIGVLLAMAVQVIFSILSSLVVFVIILFAIRLIALLMSGDQGSGFMLNQLDGSISPLVYRIARTFAFGRHLTYRAALITAIVVLIFLQIGLRVAIAIVMNILLMLPF